MTTQDFIKWYEDEFESGGLMNLNNYRECEFYLRGMAAVAEDGETVKHLIRCADVLFHASHFIEQVQIEERQGK